MNIGAIEKFSEKQLLSGKVPTPDKLDEFCAYISGGENFEEFLKKVKRHNKPGKCSNIWFERSTVYRCHTCGLSPSMVLCSECFETEKHAGHDYHMILSWQGICDCGDADFLFPSMFCSEALIKVPELPKLVYYPAEILLPGFTLKMLRLFLAGSRVKANKDALHITMLGILRKITDASSYFKSIVTEALVNQGLYDPKYEKELNTTWQTQVKSEIEEMKYYLGSFSDINWQGVDQIIIDRRTILDSLFIWYVKNNFHNELFQWFVTLTTDDHFKLELAKTFASNYFYVALYVKSKPHFAAAFDSFSFLSYLLLAWPSKAVSLFSDHHILHYILVAMRHYLAYNYKVKCRGGFTTSFDVIRRDYDPLMYQHTMQHFLTFISHKDVSYRFITNEPLVWLWLNLVSRMQGMYETIRSVRTLFKFPVQTCLAFYAQVELCIFPMWSMIYQHPNESIFTHVLLQLVIEELHNWISNNRQRFYEVTFHLPLHRILSLAVSKEMKNDLTPEHLKFEREFLKLLIQRPLRLWAASTELLLGFWKKNGYAAEDQSKYYKVSNFCACTVDPDIFLMQIACSQMNSDFFVQLVMECFEADELLLSETRKFMNQRQANYMLDEFLFIFAFVISARALAGANNENLLRLEVLTSLARKSSNYTEFVESISEKGPQVRDEWMAGLDHILHEVADFEPISFGSRYEPLNGIFRLKDEIFLNEYDPVLVRVRSVGIDDYQNSVQNYIASVENLNLKKKKVDLWAPFRRPSKPHHSFINGFTNFLHCPSFHALIFILLHQCTLNAALESTLQIIIHLLNMSFHFPYYNKDSDLFETSSSLIQACLIPFDFQHDVLNTTGLMKFIRDQLDFESQRNDGRVGYNPKKPLNKIKLSLFPVYQATPEPSRHTILSLLLQLFKMYVGKIYHPLNLRGEGAVRYGSAGSTGVRIGGAEYFIGEVLDQLVDGSEEVLVVVENYVAQEAVTIEIDRKAELKRKAEAKKKAMKEKMLEKKKKFMEKAYIEEENKEKEEEEERTDCCICTQPLFSSLDNPVCSFSLITRTNLMGHRVSEDHHILSHVPENTFAFNFRELNKFSSSIFPDAVVNPIWFDSSWIQTCNHLFHYSCYFDFIKNTLDKEKDKKDIYSYEREFWCPVCRQLCNFMLPSIHLEPQKLPSALAPSNFNLITHLYNIAKSISLPKALLEIEVFFVKKAFIEGNYFNEYLDLFRNNVELHLMNEQLLNKLKQTGDIYVANNKLFKPTKKVDVRLMYDFCNAYVRRHIPSDIKKMLNFINPNKNSLENMQNFNIALVDMKQLLITTILIIPKPQKDFLNKILEYFINLYLIQLLCWIVVSCKSKSIVKCISKYKLYKTHLGMYLDFLLKTLHKPINFQETQRSLVDTLKERLKEFLKFCLTVKLSITREPFPHNQEILGMKELYGIIFGKYSLSKFSTLRCVGWDSDTVVTYLHKFSLHTNFLMQVSPAFKMAEDLLLTKWKPPKLTKLPSTYDEFYSHAMWINKQNNEDISSTKRMKMCLTCASITNFSRETYLYDENMWHSEVCGKGTSIFFNVKSNQVRILWGRRSMGYNSPYVDDEGEDRISVMKYKEMYYNDERYKTIEKMWLFNCFDLFCKNWNLVLP